MTQSPKPLTRPKVPTPEKVLKVLHVIGSLNRGGAEVFLLNLIRSSAQVPVEIYVLCFGEQSFDLEEDVREAGAVVLRVSSARNLLALRRVMRSVRPNVVHAHTDLNAGVSILAARLAKVPVRVTHAHLTNYLTHHSNIIRGLYEYAMMRIIRSFSTLRVACGSQAGQALFMGEKFAVLRNGVDLAKFRFRSETRFHYRQELLAKVSSLNTFVVGCVARLEPVKNHEFLIRVAHELAYRKFSAKFFLVGRGSEEPRLQQLCRELELSSYVEFLGLREDIPELLNAFDLVVLPSKLEGFPVIAVEAQANGLPMLISDAVDPEVQLSPSCQLLPISAGNSVHIWADAIEQVAQKSVERAQATDYMSQFDGARIGAEAYNLYVDSTKL